MIREILFAFAVIGFISADPFPSDLERCHFGDTECLKILINEYVRTLKDGHKGLDLPPIDPLYVKELSVIQKIGGLVNLNLKFKDFLFGGLTELKLTNVVGFEKDITTSKYELYAHIPHAVMTGAYKSRGELLLVGVDGGGHANMTFDDFDLIIKCVNPQMDVRDGKEYVNIYKSQCTLTFEVSNAWFDFENVITGSELLSKSTNFFVNQHWKLILEELKPALSKTICSVIKNVIARVFAKIPYEELLI